MLNSEKKICALSEKKILNETKNHNPPLQVKWSVPKTLLCPAIDCVKQILHTHLLVMYPCSTLHFYHAVGISCYACLGPLLHM